MFSLFKRNNDRKRCFNYQQIFTVEVPESWRENKNASYLSLSGPADMGAVTGNAFAKQKVGSLADFSKHRFGDVAEMKFYSQIGDEAHLVANGHDFVIREFEGIWPDETDPTYYVVACTELDGAYVSLTVTTSPREFQSNKKLYMEIITSVEPVT